jgi:hypothetical protein
MIGAPFQTVTCDPGGRIGVPAHELVNAFGGRRSRFAHSSLPEKPGSQQANSGIAWQSAFGHGSLIEGRPSGECWIKEANMKKVVVSLRDGYFGKYRRLKILVDGLEVGSLSQGERQALNVPDAAKNLEGKMDWGRTKSVDISNLSIGDIVVFEPNFSTNPFKMLGLAKLPIKVNIQRGD